MREFFRIATVGCAALLLSVTLADECSNFDEIAAAFPSAMAERMPVELAACVPLIPGAGLPGLCEGMPDGGGACGMGEGCRLDLSLQAADATNLTYLATIAGYREGGEPLCQATGSFGAVFQVSYTHEIGPGGVRFYPNAALTVESFGLTDCNGQPLEGLFGPDFESAALARVQAELEERSRGSESVCDPALGEHDSDGDGTADCFDLCPADPNKVDPGCGCGVVDDADGDGFSFCADDCDDSDAGLWATPGATAGLSAVQVDATTTRFSWQAPAQPGAVSVSYFLLRATSADGFLNGTCVNRNGEPQLDDAAMPGAGGVFFYLPRAVNACAEGQGSVGGDSTGQERAALLCAP